MARFFPRGSEGFSLYPEINSRIIEEATKRDGPDLIFTVAWALDQPTDWALMEQRKRSVEEHGHSVYWVELWATQEERIRRHGTPLRLRQKPRQARELTPEIMKELDGKYALNSVGDFPWQPYLRIDVESLAPKETVAAIRANFIL